MRKHGAKNKLKDTEREDSNYMGLAVPMLLAAVISIAIPLQQANAQLTFGNPPINLSNNPTNSFRPGVAVSGNNVYVIWQEGHLENIEILFKRMGT